MTDLVEEDEEAQAFLATKVEELARRPEDAEWPDWATHVRNAFADLSEDRHFGAMGGIGRISFSAIDRYAQRHNLTGNAFDNFFLFLRALDDEYVRHVLERQKEEAAKSKKPE